jgi:hypothetical protein
MDKENVVGIHNGELSSIICETVTPHCIKPAASSGLLKIPTPLNASPQYNFPKNKVLILQVASAP